METSNRLSRPNRLNIFGITGTIETIRTIIWKPGFNISLCLDCLAGGIVGARNDVLTSERRSREENGERTLKYRLHENHGFFNSPHTSVRKKRIGREKYTRQSNVKLSLIYFPRTLCFAYDKLF